MIHDLTVAEAKAKAEHLIALGETTIWLRDETDFPFDKVHSVEVGSSYRLSGPASCYLLADEAGLTFRLNVDFEGRDANGRGVSLFDRDRLRELILKLPDKGRKAFANLLQTQVLSAMAKRTTEYRNALREQSDSEDCVRGLIAFGLAEQVAA